MKNVKVILLKGKIEEDEGDDGETPVKSGVGNKPVEESAVKAAGFEAALKKKADEHITEEELKAI